MYSEEDGAIIDGVHNAKEHARYIKSILDLAEMDVNSIADFGFGKGILLHEFIKEFKPKQILAIDPSKEAVTNLSKQKWLMKIKHKILQTTIEKFSESKTSKTFDLGICNSIFQYIANKDVTSSFEKLSRLCKYLYFAVPTKVDYDYMKKELNFIDPYSNSRTKQFYLKALSPHFTIVSYNLLESKVIQKDSGFTYEFFRF